MIKKFQKNHEKSTNKLELCNQELKITKLGNNMQQLDFWTNKNEAKKYSKHSKSSVCTWKAKGSLLSLEPVKKSMRWTKMKDHFS